MVPVIGIILQASLVICLSDSCQWFLQDGEMIMGTDDGSAVLLAEFRMWLVRERGLQPATVRCYGNQARAFLAATGGPGGGGRAGRGQVTAFMVDHSRDRNAWSAKAMVTSLRAFLRFACVTGRTPVPLAGAVPAVASWRLSALPQGLPAADIERLLAGCDRDTAAGLRDYAILCLLARLGLRGAEAAGLQLDDSTGGPARSRSPARAAARAAPLLAVAGEAIAAWLAGGRPRCGSRAVFVTVRRPYRQLTPAAVREVMAGPAAMPGSGAGARTGSATRWRPSCCAPARRCPRSGRCSGTVACCPRRYMPRSTRTRCAAGAPVAGSRAVSALLARAEEYLAMRRTLGFKLTTLGPRLMTSPVLRGTLR